MKRTLDELISWDKISFCENDAFIIMLWVNLGSDG